VPTHATARIRRHADLAGALLFAVACLAVLFLQPVSADQGVTRSADAIAVVCVLVATLPLALRRRLPLTVAAIVVPLSIAGTLRGYAINLTALGALFSLASAAYFTDRARTIAIGAYGIVALLVASVITGGPLLSLQLLVSNLASPVLAVVAGDVMRGRREYARRWRARAREIEELRDADQRRAMAQERARAGARRIGADPARAAEALAEIDALASRALADTRTAVGLIGDENERAPTHPVGAA
jgi:signal transduction histidine kinase